MKVDKMGSISSTEMNAIHMSAGEFRQKQFNRFNKIAIINHAQNKNKTHTHTKKNQQQLKADASTINELKYMQPILHHREKWESGDE